MSSYYEHTLLFRPILQIISLHLLKVLQGKYAHHFWNKEIDTQKFSQPAKMLSKFFMHIAYFNLKEFEKMA